MASRGSGKNISVTITGEAEFDKARRDIAADLDKIEKEAKDIKLSPELDTSEIRQAIKLAEQLDGMVASFTVDTDLSEIKQAEEIARSLRNFQGRVDLSVEGRAELSNALGLAEKMDGIRQVKVQVQGQQDLANAGRLADDLERRRTVPIDAQAADLIRLDDKIEGAIADGAHKGAKELTGSVEGAFDGIDPGNIAGSLQGKLTSALGAAGGVGAVIGLAAELWGDDLAEGFNRGFNRQKLSLQAQIETGFSEADLRPIGEAAGAAYSEGFGEGLYDLTVQAATLEATLRTVDQSFDLKQATEAATVLEEHLGIGIPEGATIAARMIRQGLAKDTVEAYDIMTHATQQYGQTGVEALDLTREFGGVMTRLGLDGAASVDFIARSYQQGLFPTIDRGAELWEEFNVRITDGDAQKAVEGLGLSMAKVQAAIAEGGPAANAALQEILTTLLNMEDPALRDAYANQLFGQAIESATNKPEALRWMLQLSQAHLDVAGTSAKATEQAKEMQTEFDKSKRVAQNLADTVGGVVLPAFNQVAGSVEQVVDGFGLWGDTSDNVSGKMQALGNGILALAGGPLAVLADDLIGGAVDWATWWNNSDKAAESLGVVGNEVAQSQQAMARLRDSTNEASDATGNLTEKTFNLDEALKAFNSRFEGDRVMRKLEEDVIAATEATQGLTTKNYDLSNGFDITTKQGRAAAAALEDLSLDTASLAQAFVNGNATAADLADGQKRVEGTLRDVARQMGLNQAETDNLIARYGSVQQEIVTTAIFNSEHSLAAILAYQREIGAIPSFKSTTVATHFVSTGTRVWQVGGGFAEGGPVKGGVPIVVGEKGDELFVPETDGVIIPHDETRRILAGDSNARAMANTGGPQGGAGWGGGVQRVELVIGSDGSALGNMLVRAMRKEVKNRGGLDVVFA